MPESKTDCYREGITLKVAANGTKTCPVAAMLRMYKMRIEAGAKPEDPLYVMRDGSYLTRKILQREMRTSLAAVGMVPGEYASHSLRIGGATSLAACEEFDSDRIRILGRWSSDCFLRYLRQTDMMRKEASRAMATIASADWRTLGRKAFDPTTAE